MMMPNCVTPNINPASLENLATLQVAGIKDVDRAVEAAEIGIGFSGSGAKFRLLDELRCF